MNSFKDSVSVVIPAAGEGKRMKSAQNKLLIPLDGVPLIVYSLKVFIQSPLIQEVILVVPPEKCREYEQDLVLPLKSLKPIKLVNGGERRQDSVHKGVQAVSKNCNMVMVHDGARPFVTEKMIETSIKETRRYGACVVGVSCKSTIKECDEKQIVVRTPRRENLWEIQTPQTAKLELLKKAFEWAEKEKLNVTDEAMLIEALGEPVKIVMGDYSNIKITTPEDIIFAQLILRNKK